MAYSEQVLHRARARLEQAKAEREQENAAHRADAYARYPRLAEIDNELRRTMAELNDQWYGSVWDDVHHQADALDDLIQAFNEETGVAKTL